MAQFMSQRPVTEVPQEDEGWGVLGWGLEGRKAGQPDREWLSQGPEAEESVRAARCSTQCSVVPCRVITLPALAQPW